jgi:hypothetical protein
VCLEDSAGVDRLAALLAHAKSLAVDELVAGNNADGEAGAIESCHALGNVALKPGNKGGNTRLHSGIGIGRPCHLP